MQPINPITGKEEYCGPTPTPNQTQHVTTVSPRHNSNDPQLIASNHSSLPLYRRDLTIPPVENDDFSKKVKWGIKTLANIKINEINQVLTRAKKSRDLIIVQPNDDIETLSIKTGSGYACFNKYKLWSAFEKVEERKFNFREADQEHYENAILCWQTSNRTISKIF